MVQTVRTFLVSAGKKQIVLEKPHILHRIFFFIRVLASQTSWYPSGISLGDPKFGSYLSLNGPEKYFEANGEDIFQGDIWVLNNSNADLSYTVSEILH